MDNGNKYYRFLQREKRLITKLDKALKSPRPPAYTPRLPHHSEVNEKGRVWTFA